MCIGLEVHAQLRVATKLFSGASSAGAKLSSATPPNEAVSLFDAAHPGTMPQVNVAAVGGALRAAAALRARVPAASAFDRKHYFYGDLPLGYQITQCDAPIAERGVLAFDVPVRLPNGKRGGRETARRVTRIARLQLEQDSGKSVHTLAADASFVDLNRAGVALLEIVTAPDLRSADDAGAFLRALQSTLRHVGVSDGAMEEGAMRADVNVSVRRVGSGDGAHASALTRGVARGAALMGVGDGAGGYVDDGQKAESEYPPPPPSQSAEAAPLADPLLRLAEEDGDGRLGWTWRYSDPTADPWHPTVCSLLDDDVLGTAGTTQPAAAPPASSPLSSTHRHRTLVSELGGVSSSSSSSSSSGPASVGSSGDAGAWVRLSHSSSTRTASAASVPPTAPHLIHLAAWGAALHADAATPPYGARVELKNVSSIRAVEAAVTAEALRQVAVLEGGGTVERETRVFDVLVGVSSRLRGKEDEVDYRFMREPDLAPLLISRTFLDAQLAGMPEPLSAVRARYVAALGLAPYDAGVLVGEPGAPAYFEAALAAAQAALPGLLAHPRMAAATTHPSPQQPQGMAAPPPSAAPSTAASLPGTSLPKLVCNWLCSELFGRVQAGPSILPADPTAHPPSSDGHAPSVAIATAVHAGVGAPINSGVSSSDGSTHSGFPIDALRFGSLVAAVAAGLVSGRNGKLVLEALLLAGPASSSSAAAHAAPLTPLDIIARDDLWQENDPGIIAGLAATLLATPAGREMGAAVAGGRERVLGALVAGVMAASGGRANPAIVSEQVVRLAREAAAAAAAPPAKP